MSLIRVAWRIFLGGTLVVMSVSVGLGIVSRYVFNAPIIWTDELARYALVWMTFLGGAELLLRRDGHIAVGYFRSLLPAALDRKAEIGVMVVSLLIVAMTGYGGILLIEHNLISVSAALGVPMYVVYGVIPAASGLGILILGHRIIRVLAGHREAE